MIKLKSIRAFTLTEGATHVAYFDKIRRAAFTLAEVLITLGIIGVVAAMTMPSLIQSYKRQEATARLKKFSSMMSQAVIMSEMENGEMADWTYTAESGTVTNSMATKEFFMTYFAKYIKYISTEDNAGVNKWFQVNLPDGTYFQMYKGGCIDFFLDINGSKYPNLEGRDIFRFLACPTTQSFCSGKGGWCSYYDKNDTTREKRLERCKQQKQYCSGLLEYDNWEFKSDYPHRL